MDQTDVYYNLPIQKKLDFSIFPSKNINIEGNLNKLSVQKLYEIEPMSNRNNEIYLMIIFCLLLILFFFYPFRKI